LAERPNIEKLANATSAGLLAEEMIFAIAGLLRGTQLAPDEKSSVATAKALLESLASPAATAPPTVEMRSLSADEEALDALQAVLVQAPGQDLQQYLGRLIGVLDVALAGNDVTSYTSELKALQELFSTLGHLTLARANSLTRAPQERTHWPISAETSVS
jgi:hypothetical protein